VSIVTTSMCQHSAVTRSATRRHDGRSTMTKIPATIEALDLAAVLDGAAAAS
jgi:hypothetical protein